MVTTEERTYISNITKETYSILNTCKDDISHARRLFDSISITILFSRKASKTTKCVTKHMRKRVKQMRRDIYRNNAFLKKEADKISYENAEIGFRIFIMSNFVLLNGVTKTYAEQLLRMYLDDNSEADLSHEMEDLLKEMNHLKISYDMEYDMKNFENFLAVSKSEPINGIVDSLINSIDMADVDRLRAPFGNFPIVSMGLTKAMLDSMKIKLIMGLDLLH